MAMWKAEPEGIGVRFGSAMARPRQKYVEHRQLAVLESIYIEVHNTRKWKTVDIGKKVDSSAILLYLNKQICSNINGILQNNLSTTEFHICLCALLSSRMQKTASSSKEAAQEYTNTHILQILIGHLPLHHNLIIPDRAPSSTSQ